jgi:hypothetical protein
VLSLTGDPTAAKEAVKGAIESKEDDLRLVDPKSLHPSDLISGENRVSQTLHAMKGDEIFTIYHLFLPLVARSF